VGGALSEAAWDEADLAIRLCRALDLAKRVITWFASEGYSDPESPANSFQPEKPLGETAPARGLARGAVGRVAVDRRGAWPRLVS